MAVFVLVAKFLQNFWKLNLVGYAVVFSVCVAFSEYLRGNFLGGFPWNIIGYVWSDSYILLQPVGLIGIYGLGLFSILAILSIYLFKIKISFGLYSLMPLIILISLSYFIFNIKNDEEYTNIKVRLVQPNIIQEEKWDDNLKDSHFKKLVKMSSLDYDYFKPKYIIWPESAFQFDKEILKYKNFSLFNWLDDDQLLITGATRKEYKNTNLDKVFNSVYFINKSGEIVNYYDKVKLVPFGEFIPLRGLYGLEKLTKGTMDFSSGVNSNIINLNKDFIKIGVLICYEIIFPGDVINGPRPDFLINLTNDAWYRNSIGPVQHLSAARVRAIEEGITVLRIANTGISAVIAPSGKYIKKLSLENEGVIDMIVPKKIDPTLFSKYGNFIYIILSLCMLFLSRILFRDLSYNIREK
tara:strand:- start:19406 stop:20635 length:1230 start_codon:yes stop_codon:yes gene_type:complete